MTDPLGLLETLATQAAADGGWGYAPDQPAHLEPTCLALLALAADTTRYRTELERGRAALRQHAAGDGFCRRLAMIDSVESGDNRQFGDPYRLLVGGRRMSW